MSYTCGPPPPPLPPVGTRVLSQESTKVCTFYQGGENLPKTEASKLLERLFSQQPRIPSDRLWISFYSAVRPVLQKGPSCGLAALSMANQLVRSGEKLPWSVTLQDAVEFARLCGYSYHGEMFSALDMKNLAEDLLQCDVELLSDSFEQRGKIAHHLAKGLPILVPYDADANNEPCCMQGHKAHWAVLLGLVFKSNATEVLPGWAFEADSALPWLYHGCAGKDVEIVDQVTSETDVYVYAKQGKSNHTGLWSLEALASSNDNLHEISPQRRNSVHKYVLPEDGSCSGLKRKVLLVG